MDEILLAAPNKEVKYEVLLFEGGLLIPPGRALRQMESDRLRPRTGKSHRGVMTGEPRPAPPERIVKKSQEELIRMGRRNIAQDSVQGAVNRGAYERFERDGEKWVRLVKTPSWKQAEEEREAENAGDKNESE